MFAHRPKTLPCQSVPARSSCLHSTRLKPKPLLVWLLQPCLQKHGRISDFAASLLPHIHTPCLKSPPPPLLLTLQAPLCTYKPIPVPGSRSPASVCQGMGPTHIPPPMHSSAVSAAGYALLQASLSLPKAKRAAGRPPPNSPLLCFLSFLAGTQQAVHQPGLRTALPGGHGPRPSAKVNPRGCQERFEN